MINVEQSQPFKPKGNSFDMDDTSIQGGKGGKMLLIDNQSQMTHGNGSMSTRTKEEEDEFDLSFE